MKAEVPTIEIGLHPDPARRRKFLESVGGSSFMTVWEGSVRSSKTVAALVAFSLYVVRSPERKFMISGRTMSTVLENCIRDDFGLLNLMPGSELVSEDGRPCVRLRVADGRRTVVKRIMAYGASDIRAYMALRGKSYGGWMADEINMHDAEFVAEGMKRTAASNDRRHFWTLNPDSPDHWIYSEYIDVYRDMDPARREELGGYRWFHFTPDDNPAMTPKKLASLKAQYVPGSVQYARYVLGERCIAEGLVYPFMDRLAVEDAPPTVQVRYASIDFGTVHPTAMGWYGKDPATGVWWKVREWRATPLESAWMTTADYMNVFERITSELGGLRRMDLTIDPGGGGEALAREAQRRRWYPQTPDKSVLDGIAMTADMLNSGELRISSACPLTWQELKAYHWEDKGTPGRDVPHKDGDDLADETRYMVATFLADRRKWKKHTGGKAEWSAT